jgi:hypothetical protein
VTLLHWACELASACSSAYWIPCPRDSLCCSHLSRLVWVLGSHQLAGDSASCSGLIAHLGLSQSLLWWTVSYWQTSLNLRAHLNHDHHNTFVRSWTMIFGIWCVRELLQGRDTSFIYSITDHDFEIQVSSIGEFLFLDSASCCVYNLGCWKYRPPPPAISILVRFYYCLLPLHVSVSIWSSSGGTCNI